MPEHTPGVWLWAGISTGVILLGLVASARRLGWLKSAREAVPLLLYPLVLLLGDLLTRAYNRPPCDDDGDRDVAR